MKNRITTAGIGFTLVIATLLLATGCAKKDDNNIITNNCNIDATAIKATINGGSFSNQTYSLVAATQCLTLYSSKTDSLCVINSSGGTSQNSGTEFHILVEFYGDAPGNFSIVPASGLAGMGDAYVQLDIITASGNTILFSQSGTVTVTELGASGGKISATFSGTFTDSNGASYTVTNGYASGTRT